MNGSRAWRTGRAGATLLLVALPAAFVAGHAFTAGTTWNHATGAAFSPWANYVSDYAYRSPVWWLFVGCMYALALLLGLLSLASALRPGGRPVLAWLCSSLLAFAGLKLCEVALFPVKPPEITVEQLQARMDASTWQRLKDEIHRAGLSLRGGAPGREPTVMDLVAAHESNANHLLGITPAMAAIFVTMLLLPLQHPARWRSPGRRLLLALALLMTVMATPGTGWFGAQVGLAQRLGFLGVYLWLWLCRGAVADQDSAASGRLISR
jgi:hypothetical protein